MHNTSYIDVNIADWNKDARNRVNRGACKQLTNMGNPNPRTALSVGGSSEEQRAVAGSPRRYVLHEAAQGCDQLCGS
jgi:hypothetical protein